MRILKSIRNITLMSIALAVGACQLLETEPVSSIESSEGPQSISALEALLNGAYSSTWSSNTYGGMYWVFAELISDNFVVGDESFAGNFELYRRNLNNRSEGRNMYSTGYRAINAANEVIDAIETGKLDDGSSFYALNRDRWLGEAYFIRAIHHFELCRIFCVQYNENQMLSASDMGIPLALVPTFKFTDGRPTRPKASVQEIYDQVIKDLENAKTLLPAAYDPNINDRRYYRRATNWSATAMLARVHFQKATKIDNDLAVSYASEILGSGPVKSATFPSGFGMDADWTGEKDKSPFFKEGYQQSKETIFQICNFELNSSSGLLASRFTVNVNATGDAQYRISGTLKGIASANSLNSINSTFASDIPNKFYRGLSVADFIQINVPIIRTPELMFIRAEVWANQASSSLDPLFLDAVAEVNSYRRFRNNGSQAPSNLTPCELVDYIRSQRRLELYSEGNRLYDFKRAYVSDINNISPCGGVALESAMSIDNKKSLQVNLENGQASEAQTTVMPIPLQERASNSALGQKNVGTQG